MYKTKLRYNDRKEKAKYVYDKYKHLLDGKKILDVGADHKHLSSCLPENSNYTGIGLGGSVDIEVNLEKEKIPFSDECFDTVICLDVLEHLENIHAVFDDLCRISKTNLIISLPNPFGTLWESILRGGYSDNASMKYYHLPVEAPSDRHKWFYSLSEAESFIRYRSDKNNMLIEHMEAENFKYARPFYKNMLLSLFRVIDSFGHKRLKEMRVYDGTLWCVLKKDTSK
jgi:hypothetical protein